MLSLSVQRRPALSAVQSPVPLGLREGPLQLLFHLGLECASATRVLAWLSLGQPAPPGRPHPLLQASPEQKGGTCSLVEGGRAQRRCQSRNPPWERGGGRGVTPGEGSVVSIHTPHRCQIPVATGRGRRGLQGCQGGRSLLPTLRGPRGRLLPLGVHMDVWILLQADSLLPGKRGALEPTRPPRPQADRQAGRLPHSCNTPIGMW